MHLTKTLLFSIPLFALAIGSLVQGAPEIASTEAARGALPPEVAIDLGGGVSMEFVLVSPGKFTMGTETYDPDEKPVREVTISRPYYMGKYEVTQEQWHWVVGNNPSHFRKSGHPVEGVNWHDCQNFLRALEEKVGRRFSLPTEAQWEFACRAGTTTEYAHGDDVETLADYGWYSQNSDLTTHPVGKKKPNAWGIHDMHGNVYEWCSDWYSEGPYASGSAVDPAGPAKGRRKVLRGGGWIFVPDNLRSSDRGFSPPDMRSNEYGFRCVLLVDDPREGSDKNATGSGDDARADAGAKGAAASIDAAIAEADRLGAVFLLGDFRKRHRDDGRIAGWEKQIGEIPVPPERLSVPVGEGVLMEFVLIRPGVFVMGSDGETASFERPAHQVTITRSFYLGKFEVTQRQWNAVMDRNDSAFRDSDNPAATDDLPVDMVNWPLAQSFAGKLNEVFPAGGFRLPTEAEWEYACRAGTRGERFFETGALGDYAWFGENAQNRTHAGGGKKPNAWGLHDMYGNVWEWCEDRFGAYSADPAVDPTGPDIASIAGARVARGGAWNNREGYVSSVFRHDVPALSQARFYGFRCAASVRLAAEVAKRRAIQGGEGEPGMEVK